MVVVLGVRCLSAVFFLWLALPSLWGKGEMDKWAEVGVWVGMILNMYLYLLLQLWLWYEIMMLHELTS